MGKVTRIKGEIEEVAALLEIISVMKDVSTNRFFVFSQQKKNYSKFFEILDHFFEMFESVDAAYPYVKTHQAGVDILVVTSEQSFMSGLNGKVCSAALDEYQKHPEARLICVGPKGAEKCRSMGMKVEKIFTDEGVDRYGFSLSMRDYLLERVAQGVTGRVVLIYMWAKSFSLLRPRIIHLLPLAYHIAEAAVRRKKNKKTTTEESHSASEKKFDFIQETRAEPIARALADIWVKSHLFECAGEKDIVESAAQAQQLESAMEGLTGEFRGLKVSYRKAGREKLNQAMREVFTAASMMKRKAREIAGV